MSQHLRRAVVFSLLLLLLSFTQALAQTALERVRSSGELRIGTDATYPPFENKEDGEFKGFDIDLGNAIAKEALPVLKEQGIRFARRGSS